MTKPDEITQILIEFLDNVEMIRSGVDKDIDEITAEAHAALIALVNKARIDELNQIGAAFFEYLKPDVTAMNWIAEVLKTRLDELEKPV